MDDAEFRLAVTIMIGVVTIFTTSMFCIPVIFELREWIRDRQIKRKRLRSARRPEWELLVGGKKYDRQGSEGTCPTD